MITRTPTRHVSWGLAAILLLSACSAAPSSDETSVTQGLDGTTTSITVAVAPDAPDTVTTDTVITAPTDTSGEPSIPGTLVAHIDEVFPHDRGAFTQGLAMRDGLFYESTGVRGDSSVRIVEPQTGEVLSQVDLPDQYFGEGLEVVDDRIVQLTWTAGIAFIWDVKTLEPLGTYSYEGEGWGLCARDGMFYMSNGSSQLTVRHLDTFEALSTVDVTYLGEPVESLNELEWYRLVGVRQRLEERRDRCHRSTNGSCCRSDPHACAA